MLRSLVGSEMCIRDRYQRRVRGLPIALRWTSRSTPRHLGHRQLPFIWHNLRHPGTMSPPSLRCYCMRRRTIRLRTMPTLRTLAWQHTQPALCTLTHVPIVDHCTRCLRVPLLGDADNAGE
eukprot:TRINITY_DN6942_c0_g1_i1.p1 TRINITY_DN6942_c0_g1~~TRINITY_DN6942_c0_g1_i1.p1  ORF type:complete len:121 (-),score=16.28 TRINITY_DN6942_c0_g1_i1:532-894(-)